MSHRVIVRLLESSQREIVHIRVLVPPQREGSLSPVDTYVGASGGATIFDTVSFGGIVVQHRPEWTGDHEELYLDAFQREAWSDFNEGLEDIVPSLIKVYPYRCGICHQEEVYAEDPELENYHPYHCHGHHKPPRSVLGMLSRVYHLRRLEPRWVPKNEPGVLYSQKAEGA